MFQVTVQGESIEELKGNLLNLASCISTDKSRPMPGEDFGYAGANLPPSKTNRPAPVPKDVPTVPHVYPTPDSPEEAHADLNQAEELQVNTGSPGQMIQSANAPTTTSSSVDSRGLPWDERIHASSKATTKDGSWRYKRGVEEDEIKLVEASLRPQPIGNSVNPPLAMPGPSPLSLVPPPPAPTVAVDPAPYAQQVVAPVQPVAAAPATAYDAIQVPAMATKPAHTIESFAMNIFVVIANLITEKKLEPAYVNELNKYFGVDQIYQIQKDPAKVKELFDMLVGNGLITAV